MVRRLCFRCFLVALWPGLAAAQSRELIEADKQVKAPYAQGRYAEAEPFAVEALKLGEKAFWTDSPDNDPSVGEVRSRSRTHHCEGAGQPRI